jgi:hypothetical protein
MPTDFGMASTRPSPMLAANVVSEAAKMVQARDGYNAPFNAANRFATEIKPVNEQALADALIPYLLNLGNPAMKSMDDYYRGQAMGRQNELRNSDFYRQGELMPPDPIAGSQYSMDSQQLPTGAYKMNPGALSAIFTAFGR